MAQTLKEQQRAQQERLQTMDKQLFQEWKEHPVTRQLMEWARLKRENLKEDWAQGHFTAAFDLEMLVKNAAATSACSILDDLLNIDYLDIEE